MCLVINKTGKNPVSESLYSCVEKQQQYELLKYRSGKNVAGAKEENKAGNGVEIARGGCK